MDFQYVTQNNNNNNNNNEEDDGVNHDATQQKLSNSKQVTTTTTMATAIGMNHVSFNRHIYIYEWIETKRNVVAVLYSDP
jgi:hypothetical protein